jgi:hypothetical protein
MELLVKTLDVFVVSGREIPFPPLLFAIAADLLQCAINKEYEIGNLHPPFP